MILYKLSRIGDRTEMQTHDQHAQQELVRNGLDVRVGDVSASLYCWPFSGRQSSACCCRNTALQQVINSSLACFCVVQAAQVRKHCYKADNTAAAAKYHPDSHQTCTIFAGTVVHQVCASDASHACSRHSTSSLCHAKQLVLLLSQRVCCYGGAKLH